MIYTHFKTPFHHLSGVKQPLWKSDSGLQFRESSQVVLLRPAAAETVLLQAPGLPHDTTELFSPSASSHPPFHPRTLRHYPGRPFQSLRALF